MFFIPPFVSEFERRFQGHISQESGKQRVYELEKILRGGPRCYISTLSHENLRNAFRQKAYLVHIIYVAESWKTLLLVPPLEWDLFLFYRPRVSFSFSRYFGIYLLLVLFFRIHSNARHSSRAKVAHQREGIDDESRLITCSVRRIVALRLSAFCIVLSAYTSFQESFWFFYYLGFLGFSSALLCHSYQVR